jgi:hypothetical protein
MGKQAKQSRKYGAPLYAVAWPEGGLVFFAGGGGKKSSGIKNRCLCRATLHLLQHRWRTDSTASAADVAVALPGALRCAPMIHCRVVAARAHGESLSDEVAALELEDCPIRMAAHPSGNALVLALGGGGLARVNVARGDGDAGPSLSLATGGWISGRP